MIIYKRKKKQLVIPCGLGPVVCENADYELQMKMVDSSTSLQQVEPDDGYYGLYRVIVNPYATEWINRPITGNGSYIITPENADALSGVEIDVDVQPNLQGKNVDSSTVTQDVIPDEGYDGLSQVTVNPYTLESKSQVITVNGEYTVSPTSADGLSSVDISVNIPDTPAVVQAKTADSSTEQQVITPDEGYDGLSSVTIDPYTLESKSDNITENGQYTYTADSADGLSSVTVDVSIDTVNNQSKSVDSSTEMQYVQPDQGYTGLDYVAVNPYTLDSKTVDSSTVSQVITSDEDGLSSVTVNPYTLESKSDSITANGQYIYTADSADALDQVTVDVSINTVNNQSKTVDSSTVSQSVTPDQGYTGLDSVTVEPYVLDSKTVNPSTNVQVVTSDEDGLSSVTVNAIIPSTLTANSSTVAQEFRPIFPNQWFNDVIVNPYTTESDSSTLTANGQYTFTPQNADALSQVTVDVSINTVNNQSKTVDSSTISQSITPDQGYTGLDSVTVNPYTLESDSSVITQNGQYVFTPTNADGLSQVTVDVSANIANIQDDASVSINGYWFEGPEFTIIPLEGYDAMSTVKVRADLGTVTIQPSSTYEPGAYISSYPEWYGFHSVIVNQVTAAIDPNIQASNIKDGVTILGVTGTYTGDSSSADTVYLNAFAIEKIQNSNTYIETNYLADANLNHITGFVKGSLLEGPAVWNMIYTLQNDFDAFIHRNLLTFEFGSEINEYTVSFTNDEVDFEHGIMFDASLNNDIWTVTANGVTKTCINHLPSVSSGIYNLQLLRGYLTALSFITFENGTDSWTFSPIAVADVSNNVINSYYGLALRELHSVGGVDTVNYITDDSGGNSLLTNYRFVTYEANTSTGEIMDLTDASRNVVMFPIGDYPSGVKLPTHSLGSKTVDSSTVSQTVTPDASDYGLSSVTVNPYTLDSKTVNSSTSQQVITSDADGLSSVTVEPYVLDSKTVDSSTVSQTITSDADGLSSVTVNPYSINNQDKSVMLVDGQVESVITPDASYDGLSSVSVSTPEAYMVIECQGKGDFDIRPDRYLSIININDLMLQSDRVADPSTSIQVIYPEKKHESWTNADVSYDGLWNVTINPVTAAIDSNIQSENIKTGVQILGVTGSYAGQQINNQSKTVDSSTSSQTVMPDSGYTGLYEVNVNPYVLDSKTVNSSTSQQVITSDEDGLSSVTVNPYVLDSKTVDSSTVSQVINSSADGLSSVTVNPYTVESKSDTLTANGQYTFTPTNADALSQVTVDVSINTVNNQSKTVDSSTSSQNVTPDQGYTGLDSVTVNPYTVESKSDTLTANGQYTFTPTSADALSQVTVDVSINTAPTLQSKTVDSSTSSQIVQADQNYDGLSQVTVNPYVLDSKTINSSTSQQIITSDADGLSSVTVNPYVLDSKTVDCSTGQQVITSDADGLSSVTINAAKLQGRSYTPQRSDNTIYPNASDGYIGFSKVTIYGVTAAIDSDIQPENIKRGVEILGVNGTFDGGSLGSKTVDSSTVSQTVTPEASDYGLSSVTVNPYTVESDSSTLTANGQYTFTPTNADALSSVTVDVSINTVNNQSKTVDSSTSSQSIIPDQGYTGLSSVTVNPYTVESITVNAATSEQTITPQNADAISSVTVNAAPLQNRTVDASTAQVIVQRTTADYYGLRAVTVNAVTSSIDSNIQAGNIKDGVTILGVTGSYVGQVINNQSKTVDSSTSSQNVTPDNGYTGLSSVTVNPYVLDSKTVDPSTSQQVITSDADGLSSVTVNAANLVGAARNPSVNQIIVTPPTGYFALSSVTINAVTSSIDSNIQAGNIKSGVSILGVTGSYVGQDPDYDTIYNALIQI